MIRLPDRFHPPTAPLAHPSSVIRGDRYRITVLTPRLIRLEWSATGVFEDRPTQTVLGRDFGPCTFRVEDDERGIRIDTPFLQLRYDRGPFTPSGLHGRVIGIREHRAIWRYGDVLPVTEGKSHNLGGTARTLDEIDGAVTLEPGLLATAGWSVVDDSRSLALTDDGWVARRQGDPDDVDLYLFAYGHDAEACLRDFHRLSGPAPMLPRFAFGNWWSRYHAYSDRSYRELMTRFDDEGLPFSVAVIDMDWHLTNDVPPEYGDGWTGFTWNRKLFPDPPALLRWLHERGLRVTLNLHPADGVRAFEEPYAALATALGMDPDDGAPVDFDIASPHFTLAYLDHVLHPMEDDGVDFWWIDWQQGISTTINGLDPLWMLNHVHFLDSARRGQRPLTFSRYAGVGSHRYPVGFSGDSVVSWASLDFQPYFTATAANVGYGWWSHDIGGHFRGVKDDELATRWVQLGVFSPLLRLHSSNDIFNSKEPWRFGGEAEAVMTRWLRFRHRLVPYLYTMNRRAHAEGAALVRPIYHTHPEARACANRSQYWFGSQLMVAPITGPRSRATGLGASHAWLPPGTWVDVFSGLVYDGGRTVSLHRSLMEYPVLAPSGAIVALTGEGDYGIDNPKSLELLVAAGADGSFTLYEDDDGAEPVSVSTRFDVDWARGTVTIHGADGDLTLLPEQRRYTVVFVGIADNGAHGLTSTYDRGSARLTIDAGLVASDVGTVVSLLTPGALADNRVAERVFDLLDAAQIEFAVKGRVNTVTASDHPPTQQLAELQSLGLDGELHAAVVELVAARVA